MEGRARRSQTPRSIRPELIEGIALRAEACPPGASNEHCLVRACRLNRRAYGYFHDLLQPLAARLLVAHPGQLWLIFQSKNKNDRNDAERLAKLLYLGVTPIVHAIITRPRVIVEQSNRAERLHRRLPPHLHSTLE